MTKLVMTRKVNSQAEPVHYTRTPQFKNWFGEWEDKPDQASKVVDEESGKPLVVYHGSARPDRIGNRFQKKRATSGSMAYFTSDPDIASGYATSKPDNNLLREDEGSVADRYSLRVPGQRNPVKGLDRIWYHLTPEKRQELAQNLRHVHYKDPEDYESGYEVKPEGGGFAPKDIWDYESGEKHNRFSAPNHLKAAHQIWNNSSELIGREHELSDVIRAAGLPGVQYEDPHALNPGVHAVHLNIRNPLDTENIPEDLYDSLEATSRKAKWKPTNDSVDMWDKNGIHPGDWMRNLYDDEQNGTTNAWTQIPDWVTNHLKEKGYDGIKDAGGKGVYNDRRHAVWIPFEENQVKSAYGNKGTFDPNSNRLDKSKMPSKIILIKGYSPQLPPSNQEPRDPSKPFYSNVERLIQNKMPKQASPEMVRGLLNGRIGDDEQKWTGVKDYLNSNPVVDRQGLLSHVRQNTPEIKEVWHLPVHAFQWEGTPDNHTAQVNGHRYDIVPTVGGAYGLKHDGATIAVSRSLEEAKNNAEFYHKRLTERSTAPKYFNHQLPGGVNYRELLLQYPNQKQDWVNTHWEEPNVLGHIRMNDRKDVTGRKLLHIEELQSDWHQDGRRLGYRNGELPQGWSVQEINPTTNYGDNRYEVLDDRGNQRYSSRTPELAKQGALYLHDQDRVLDAPHSKDWHGLLLKHALHEAAHGGYDKMSWTTGEHQNLRYGKEQTPDGMNGFYGSIDPKPGEQKHGIVGKWLNDYAKKWGVSVGQSKSYAGRFPGQLHSIDITPAMREDIIKNGQPRWGSRDVLAKSVIVLTSRLDKAMYVDGKGNWRGQAGESKPTIWDKVRGNPGNTALSKNQRFFHRYQQNPSTGNSWKWYSKPGEVTNEVKPVHQLATSFGLKPVRIEQYNQPGENGQVGVKHYYHGTQDQFRKLAQSLGEPEVAPGGNQLRTTWGGVQHHVHLITPSQNTHFVDTGVARRPLNPGVAPVPEPAPFTRDNVNPNMGEKTFGKPPVVEEPATQKPSIRDLAKTHFHPKSDFGYDFDKEEMARQAMQGGDKLVRTGEGRYHIWTPKKSKQSPEEDTVLG